MPQSLRPTERSREKRDSTSREQFQPPYLAPIKEASSSSPLPVQSFKFSSTNNLNIDLRRSQAVHRSSNPESFSSLYSDIVTPAAESSHAPVTTTQSPSSHFNLPGPDLSRAFESEDEDFYGENTGSTPNGQYHGHPTNITTTTDDSHGDTSFASFYYNSPVVQTPVQQRHHHYHPEKLISPLRPTTTGPSALYAAPVRGAAGYYSTRTDSQQRSDSEYY